MLWGKVDEIELSEIEPLYVQQVSRVGLERRKKLLKVAPRLERLMVVEWDEKRNKHWLIDGYPDYEAYKESGFKKVLCFIRPYSDGTERRIALLRKMFTPDTTSWLDKHKRISELIIEENKTTSEIAKLLGVTIRDVEHYLIHQDIPEHIVDLAFKNKASFPNIEKIRQLEIPYMVKTFLYERAVRKRGDTSRLTTDKLQKVKWLLGSSRFNELRPKEQVMMLEKSLTYKEFLISTWQKDVYRLLDYPRSL
ncbi:ParB-like chromosome segregation protein Spo0J [Aneurinibacillus soli]|uniref:Uncharacterized protein n=1 Tax=Aneurinibacillus soli TaxID=1500254 RepID=A0A0U5C6L7_9BACL|nr:ParB/RepB/Spo0J family partition protein [Aneurinibacillus soli]PYE61408.1 ParB-like chromosome segregation protein Spo0J [Aneurinibacillus soli]BAU27763.1 hypothetical protein CB4_01937 [Aneurinibacillus soli]